MGGEPHFDDTASFSEGLTQVKINGKWGYIDKTGEYVVQPQFSRADSFYRGLALVISDGTKAYIDKTGKFIWKSSEYKDLRLP